MGASKSEPPLVLSLIGERKPEKIKHIFKTLREVEDHWKTEACHMLIEWLNELAIDKLLELAKPFLNFIISCSSELQETVRESVWTLMFSWLSNDQLLSKEEGATFVKFSFERLYRQEERNSNLSNVRMMWSNFLCKYNARITQMPATKIIHWCAKKAKGEERGNWEEFQSRFVEQQYLTETKSQTCTITVRTTTPNSHADPTSIIVWNGNGLRARWNSAKNEFKVMLNTTDPDVVCFLEAKTDADKLLSLRGLSEFASQKGFSNIFCYWSKDKDEARNMLGREGIVIMSRIPCKIEYGLGDEELDQQARVATLEFVHFFMLVTYHPHGGFVKGEKLDHRSRWEEKLIEYLTVLQQRAQDANKSIIWGGDFNVNPHRTDWSERAFDPLRARIPKGTLPTGCREEDVQTYRRMLEAVKGTNVAEFFGKTKRTCFPNEYSLLHNYGQRIDHIVVHESLLNGNASIQITDFDVLQAFGGGRKECSDHCPLWISIGKTNEEDQEVREVMREVEVLAVEAAEEEKGIDLKPMSEEFKNDTGDVEPTDELYDLFTVEPEPEPESESEPEPKDEAVVNNHWSHYNAIDEEEICCEIGDGVKAFEDNPLPVVRGQVDGCPKDLRVLNDSGAGLEIMNSRLIQFIDPKFEVPCTESKRIKVANGTRCTLNRTFRFPIKFGDHHTDPVTFYVMDNLPFDLLIGNPTLKRWQATLSWETQTLSLKPKSAENIRIKTCWATYTGQHWRRPIALICAINKILEPGKQTKVPIQRIRDEEWIGFDSHSGLITPCRTRQVLTTKFSVGYGIADEVPEFIMVANFTDKPVQVKAGTVIAEYQPRNHDAFETRKRDNMSKGLSEGLGCQESRGPSGTGSVPGLKHGANQRDLDGDSLSKNTSRNTQWQCDSEGPKNDSSVSPHEKRDVKDDISRTEKMCGNCAGRDSFESCALSNDVGIGNIHDPSHCNSLGRKWLDAQVWGEAAGLHSSSSVINPTGELGTSSPGGERDVCNTESKHGKEADSVGCVVNNIVCNVEQNEFDWNQFEKEPLESVDLTELKKQRSEKEVEALARVLVEFKDLLSDGSLDFKTNPDVKHDTTATIETTEENPKIKLRAYGCSPEEAQEFRKVIEQKVAEGVIEPSHAQWCSNALLIRKDGKIRMVIDYRALNKVTVKDSYPMPRIQDVTDALGGSNWFTGVDCVQAFHQIPMGDERSRDLTTFKGPVGGLYRYRYMPMGLVNAMAIWSRFIDTAMDGLAECVLCYADDVLIYTKSLDVNDHIRDIRRVFERFRKYGIKIKASKLKLGLNRMAFLGIVIDCKGITPNKDKTEAVRRLPYPRTLKQLRSVLGMFAYYRKFIARFSEIARPLYEQTKKHVQNPRTSKGIVLTEDSKKAFDYLKRAITSEPIMLAYPDWDLPFEIHTDASKEGVAAILCQRDKNNKECVLMYASKTLNDIEKRYHTYEQEALAVVWAVELFRKYIRNRRTTVLTDCAALQWLKTRDQGARVMRWVVRLGEFDLDIQHRKGKKSANVDGLTRELPYIKKTHGEEIESLYDTQREMHIEGESENELTVNVATRMGEKRGAATPALPAHKRAKKVTVGRTATKPADEEPAEAKALEPEAPQPELYPEPIEEELDEKHVENHWEEKRAFFKCKVDLEATCKADFVDGQQDPTDEYMKHVRKNLDVWIKGVMYKKEGDLYVAILQGRDEKTKRVVVPECFRECVIRSYHNSMLAAHQGEKRTWLQVRETFYWPRMRKDIARWVHACTTCLQRKTPRPIHAGITEPALAQYPNETVAMDILGPFHETEQGNKWILTMMDTFTRWPMAVPIPDRQSATVAEAIYRHWICDKSVPMKIISDCAREFVSKGIKQLAARLGISMVQTAGYNPTGNSSVERFHRYFSAALTTIIDKATTNWDYYVPAVLFSYRSSVCATTGYSPFFLETGRDPSLPMANLFPYLKKKAENVESFATDIVNRLDEAFERVMLRQAIASERNRARRPEQYEPDFKPGDWLLLFSKSAKESRIEEKDEEGKGISIPTKLRNPFIGPYKMIRWAGPRTCAIEVNGKEEVYNVNRLIKHHIWDDEHISTSAPDKKPKPKPKLDDTPLQVGELIVFPIATNKKDNISPFGMGTILEIRGPNNLKIQWWGNDRKCKPSGTWRPGWVSARDNKGYYSHTKEASANPHWTNDDTTTTLRCSSIIYRGTPDETLTRTGQIRNKIRDIITKALDVDVNWH